VDKAAIRYLIDKARVENIVEIARPSGWDTVVLDVTPLEEVQEGQFWIKVALKDKQANNSD
jgi:hypothetical protein